MNVQDFITILHAYIREEFVAVSEVEDNEINIRFIDGTLINVKVACAAKAAQ